jgi:hypothetical protein
MSRVKWRDDFMADSVHPDFPGIGTQEWSEMNRRRADLIRKKNRQGLTAEEKVEYERLQRLSQAALAQTFPEPPMMDDKLDALETRLRETTEREAN